MTARRVGLASMSVSDEIMQAALDHGKVPTYTNQRCRCDECRAAWRVYQTAWRSARRAQASPCRVPGCDGLGLQRGLCQPHHQWKKEHGTEPTHPVRTYTWPAEDRFWLKVVKQVNGCWLWTAACNAYGYGFFEHTSAHRWSYQHFIGAIPHDLELDHLCRNTSCVNPAHLEPVTREENMRRAVAARIPATHCKRGHEFTPENTMVQWTGARRCRTCEAVYQREYKRRVSR